jgi:myo-inositol-1(or 4)-monophosphatase
MMDYKDLCLEVCSLATQVGDYLRTERLKLNDLKVETKGVHDYVTKFDRESELRIVERLKQLLPEAGFITEENTIQEIKEQYNWIIDPLDGTTNFIHGFPVTAVSIALKEYDRIVVGVVYEIWQKECFYAYKGGEAYLNGLPIKVTECSELNSSLLATGFPFTNFSRLPQFMNYLQWSMQNTRGLRRLGSAATDLAYVACGRCDGFFEYNLKPYDVAAGAFIVEQAGGVNTDFQGGDNWLFGGEIVSCGKKLFPQMLDSINTIMNEDRL